MCVDFSVLPQAQRRAMEHLLRIENKFLNYNRSDGVPAHDARTLLMALTREAWCDPTGLGRAWTPAARTILPDGPNRLLRALPPPYFEARELRALHLAYKGHADAVVSLVVDVDERVLLLLALERAEQLEQASQRGAYHLPTLLNKLVGLTLPEADTLWTALQTACSARLLNPEPGSPELLDTPLSLCEAKPVPVPVRR
ncbi:hypothetical protein GKZ68_20970 (plasmid) [Hymenobacter sp. BRD128]|uniref:hypothetical protein n=1 Tax=Hymenobacter sp. BRD128 TaxID=2675878 RepID=UPI0015676DB9|nr:hypothetical protein [Hymenobacter sp. BRD128]QKG59155.1 hypothetical protein GKZ68_20970 [Hymenobacter sp. BRD128]